MPPSGAETGEGETAPRWRRVLARALPTGLGRRPDTYRLVAVLDEVATWAHAAPPDAWRQRNVKSLIADLDSALAECGPAVLAAIETEAQTVRRCSSQMSPSATTSDLEQLRAATNAASQTARSSAFRTAAWADAVDTARGNPLYVDRVTGQAEDLAEALAAAHIDPGAVASKLLAVLIPSPAAQRYEPGVAAPDWSDERRIAAGAQTVAQAADEGHCVVWIRFDNARINEPVIELGRVTVFDADWCIPNAISDDGQNFPYRSEFIQAVADDARFSQYTEGQPRQYDVVVRVDLGHRAAFGAIDEAYRVVTVMIGTIAAFTGAPAWTPAGFATAHLDNGGGYTREGDGPSGWTEVDHMGQNGFADAVDRSRTWLSQMFDVDLPGDVSEALRLVGEAEQVDSRENSLRNTAKIAERSVVVLQVSAVERMAAYGDMPAVQLIADLTDYWPVGRYRAMVQQSVRRCARSLSGDDALLPQLYPGGDRARGPADLKVAYEHRERLTSATREPDDAEQCRRLLDSLADPEAANLIIDGLIEQCARVRERLARCRNALMHGNPVSEQAVQSVRSMSRFIVRSALDELVESLSSRRLLRDVIADRKAHTDDLLRRVRSGAPIWELGQDPPPTSPPHDG